MGSQEKRLFSTELITNHTVMSEEAPAVDEAPVDSKFEVPKLAEPKMDPNLDDFARMRLEKDLKELKRLIESHFEVRKKDEEELDALKDRIDKRKAVREKKRQEEEKAERERKEAEEERKKKEEEEKKKNALAAMSMGFGGAASRQQNRKGKRAADKDKKKKILADRRKQLNVDHLAGDKLMEKCIELHKWLSFLEEDKYDFEERQDFLKQELKQHRQRVNDLMGAKAKGKINTRK